MNMVQRRLCLSGTSSKRRLKGEVRMLLALFSLVDQGKFIQ